MADESQFQQMQGNEAGGCGEGNPLNYTDIMLGSKLDVMPQERDLGDTAESSLTISA